MTQVNSNIAVPAADYGDWRAEYRALVGTAGLCRRPQRGLLELSGRDRVAWLHNLVTSEVRNLGTGEGTYAFAVNVKGRTQFDVNILVLADRLWLDVDRRWCDAARTHLERYVIMEDVRIADRGGEFARLGLAGPAVRTLFAALGAPNVPLMPDIHHAELSLAGETVRAFRHDFAGVPGVELVVAADRETALWSALTEIGAAHGLAPVGDRAVDTARIEAGIPASVDDIDAEVIPPETGRVEQGISYHKGCYLGQEVIERMRAHNALARRLVGLRLIGEGMPARGAEIVADGQVRGRITSACDSPRLGAVLALGYLGTSHARPGAAVEVREAGATRAAEVVHLPLRD